MNLKKNIHRLIKDGKIIIVNFKESLFTLNHSFIRLFLPTF